MREKSGLFRSMPGRRAILVGMVLLTGALWTSCTGDPKYDPLDTSDKETVISTFREGVIEIAGKTYRRPDDVLILPDRVKYGWSVMVEDHALQAEEIAEVADGSITVLIIGNGTEGDVKVPPSTMAFLKARGIEPLVMPTQEAVDLYNRSSKENLACLLHLTN